MHLLDTDMLTHLHLGHPVVAARAHALADEEIGTTVVTQVELLKGRHDFLLKAANGAELLRAQAVLAQTVGLLERTRIVSIDARAAEIFDRWRGKKGIRKLGRADLLIACIVLANGATLVTRNVRDFRLVPGLAVENWMG
jgi:tRNA(fMet)-specific endonuclease VapC